VTVTLCTKVNNLFLAIGARLNHLLLALARRPARLVTGHVFLHYVLFAWMTIQLLPSDQTAIPLYTLLILYDA